MGSLLARAARGAEQARRLSTPVRHFPGLVRLVRSAARTYDAPVAAVARRAVALGRNGFVPHPYFFQEASVLGLLDPARSDEEVDRVVSALRLRKLQLRLSPEPLSTVIDDKAVFYWLCEAAGLPIAPVCCLVYRGYPGWAADGATPATREQWAPVLLRTLPEQFYSKPTRGDSGSGVRAFRRHGNRFFEGQREIGSAEALYDEILSDRRYDGYVLQQRVYDHPALAQISGGDALQAVRVITLVDRSGEAAVVAASWRVIVADSVVDHFYHGASGNGMTTIDVATGTLGRLVLARPDRMGIVEVDEHPRTGERVTGVQLPNWPETLELALRAARTFRRLRTIGWDIASAPEEPLLMEGNSGWAPMNQVWSVRPIYGQLADAVALEESRT
jgi:hypothetical protein